MKRLLTITVLLLGATSWLSGCGGDGGGGINADPPTVASTFPADGAAGVSLNTPISVTFSEDMDPVTLDSISVGGVTIDRIEYDAALYRVTLYAGDLLEPETSYEVTASAGCVDKQGEKMGVAYTFDFTTAAFGCGGLDDPFPSSRSIATAAEIALNRQYKLLPNCDGGGANMHYFKFTLDEAATVTATYKVVEADTNRTSWVTYYLRADGLDYAGQGAGIELGSYDQYQFARSFLPGTYYIKTGQTDDTGHTAVYNLLLATSAPCTDDAYEDNDFFDQATEVSTGSIDLRGCSLDKDYFSINLNTGQTLTVTLSYTGQYILHRMKGYNSLKFDRGFYQGDLNPSSMSVTASETGTHYVEIHWWDNGVDYSLDFDITGP